MVLNPILRDHASPVHHTCIVSECKNTRVGDSGWEQGLRPRSSGTPCRPCLLAVPSKAVDEYDTGCESDSQRVIKEYEEPRMDASLRQPSVYVKMRVSKGSRLTPPHYSLNYRAA
jgi:hypothetical protein